MRKALGFVRQPSCDILKKGRAIPISGKPQPRISLMSTIYSWQESEQFAPGSLSICCPRCEKGFTLHQPIRSYRIAFWLHATIAGRGFLRQARASTCAFGGLSIVYWLKSATCSVMCCHFHNWNIVKLEPRWCAGKWLVRAARGLSSTHRPPERTRPSGSWWWAGAERRAHVHDELRWVIVFAPPEDVGSYPSQPLQSGGRAARGPVRFPHRTMQRPMCSVAAINGLVHPLRSKISA